MLVRGFCLLLLIAFAIACEPTPLGTPPPATDAATFDAPSSDASSRCATNAECNGTARYCLRAQGACVQCLNSSHCGSDAACRQGRCVPRVACTSSRMCPEQVCDVAAGYCVDCVTDLDCPTGQECTRGVCDLPSPRCRSSRECSANGQVCHATRGVCVECNVDPDCMPGQRCTPAGACMAAPMMTCTPGAVSCADATTRRTCNAEGSAYTNTPCASGERCDAGACVADTCTPGAASCADATTRRVCNPDGRGYTSAPCAAGQRCDAGACVAGACMPGAVSCFDATTRRTCNADGNSYAIAPCAAGERCDAGACVAAGVCTPGATSCADIATRRVCNPDGRGYTSTPCAAGERCDAGTCLSLTCTPGAATCADATTRRVCNPDGRGYTSTACPAMQGCVGGACVPFRCAPGTATCSGPTTRSVCDPDGQNSTATPCPAMRVCVAGACRATVCTPGVASCISPTMRSVCNADGLGTTDTACAAGETCSGGACMRTTSGGTCAPGTLFCDASGVRRQCNSDGTTSTAMPCPGSQVCASGACLDSTADRCPGVDVPTDGSPFVYTPMGLSSAPDVGSTCPYSTYFGPYTDAVLHFRIGAARDVTLSLTSASHVQVRLQDSCVPGVIQASALGPCGDVTTPYSFRYRNLPAGDYYVVIVFGASRSPVTVTVSTSDPTSRAPGDGCLSAVPVTPDGAPATLVGVSSFDRYGEAVTTCGVRTRYMPSTDWFWRFHNDSVRDVTLTVTGAMGNPNLQVYSGCGASAVPVGRCASYGGALALRQLPVGDYIVVAQGTMQPSTATISLAVTTSSPALQPLGDACGNPAQVTVGGPAVPVLLRQLSASPDLGTRSGALSATGTVGAVDAVWHFNLPSRASIEVTPRLTASFGIMWQLQTTCARGEGIVLGGGQYNTTPATFVDLPAGDYYIVAEVIQGSSSFSMTDTLSMTARAVTAPPTGPGDTCASPLSITPDGPAVTVTPVGSLSRYRQIESPCVASTDAYDYVLRFTLDAPRDVTVQVSGAAGASFELQTRCGDPTSTLSDCRYSRSSMTTPWSSSYASLGAGTYYLIARTSSTAMASQSVTFTLTTGDAGALPYTYHWTREPLAAADFISACDAPGRVTLLSTLVDTTAVVPAPFDLRLWGTTLAAGGSVGIASTGFLSLGYPFPTGASIMMPIIPSVTGPNYLVAPLWVEETDFGRGVCAATLGAAPNRRWVVEWEDAGVSTGFFSPPYTRNRYEAILYEGRREIDFLYDDLDLRGHDSRTGSMTIAPNAVGLESRDGSAGLNLGIPVPHTRVHLAPSR